MGYHFNLFYYIKYHFLKNFKYLEQVLKGCYKFQSLEKFQCLNFLRIFIHLSCITKQQKTIKNICKLFNKLRTFKKEEPL